MNALVLDGRNTPAFCLTISLLLSLCGCEQSRFDTPQMSPPDLAKVDSVTIWFATYGEDDTGLMVDEEDYDTRRILGWLQKSQWTDDAGREWYPRSVDEVWRIDLYEDGKLIGRLGVLPLKVGHRFYDVNTHRHFENQEWEEFLITLVKRNPSQWKERVDNEY